MIHIIHTPATKLAQQRQLLAWRSFVLVLPPWLGILLWAWVTPLLQPCGSTDCNFTGVVFTPAEGKEEAPPAEHPARLTPVRVSCGAAEATEPSLFQWPSLASMNPPHLPDLPYIESDDVTLETDADALLASQPQEQATPAHRPRQSTAAASPPAAGTYTPPAYERCPQPPYPAQLRQRRVQGSVGLTISVAADGSPSSGEITQSSGNSALDRHALRWVLRHWHFQPARRNNSPCESRVLTTLHFTL